MRWAWLALLIAGCGGRQQVKKRGTPPVKSDLFAVRFEVPAGWTVEDIQSSDSRFLVRISRDDYIVWVGARQGDEKDPVVALRARGGTKATVKTTWMDLPAAMTAAEAAFSANGGRLESRLLAVLGSCHYEITVSSSRERAPHARELMLELRSHVSGLGGGTPVPGVDQCGPTGGP